MGVGVSLLLIAAGAILAWAVNATTNGLDVNTVGYILLVIGIIGLVLSMMFWSTWSGPGYFTRRRRTYSEAEPAPAGGRRTIVEDESTY
jgi:beta-lactamase regulating signal transducer with metallopeptidase domain